MSKSHTSLYAQNSNWHESEFPFLLHQQWIRTICPLLNLSHWEVVKYKTKPRAARFWANTQCYKTSKINCWSVTYKKQPCFDTDLDFIQFTHFHDPFHTQALVRGANTHKYPNIGEREGHFINLLCEISTSTLLFSIKALKTLIGVVLQCTLSDSTPVKCKTYLLGETKDVLLSVKVFRMVFFNIALGSQQKKHHKN